MTPPRARWRLGAPTLGTALLGAVAGGFALRLAFPAPSVWILAPVAAALTVWSLRRRTARQGFGIGFAAGLAFWIPLIDWIRYFLGAADAAGVGLVLLVALAAFMSLWSGLGAALIAVVLRRWPRGPWRTLWVPLVVAGIWTAREGLSATVPWGGFSWGRIGFSQAGGALDGLFSWVGTPGVTFLVVAVAALAVELVAAPRTVSLRLGGIPATAFGLLLVLVPAFPVPTQGSLTVAGVQGNTKSSYADPPRYRGDVLRAQAAATASLRGRGLGLVVWPEGGSDLDPLADPSAAGVWDAVVRETGAPLLGWSVTERNGRYFNTSLLWTASGAGASYDKRHPVPFGEYVPARPVFQAIVPGLVDLLQREYTPGTDSPVIAVSAGGAAEARAGVFICFDIADDSLAREAVADGAQFLVAPSNNTDFGRYSDESDQQLQIARVRALESGRTLVAVSTVDPTAVISSDGTVTERLPGWAAGTVVARVPLSHGTPPASAFGGLLEKLLGAFGVAGWLAVVLRRRFSRSRAT